MFSANCQLISPKMASSVYLLCQFLHLVLEVYFHVIGKYVWNEYGIFSFNVHKSSINWNRKNCFFSRASIMFERIIHVDREELLPLFYKNILKNLWNVTDFFCKITFIFTNLLVSLNFPYFLSTFSLHQFLFHHLSSFRFSLKLSVYLSLPYFCAFFQIFFLSLSSVVLSVFQL